MPPLGILEPKAISQQAERLTGNEPTPFLDWCQQKDSFPPATQLTIGQLLDGAGTMGYNQISDVSALSSLTNLTLLGLIENEISDISPFALLTNLRELRLTSNAITDIFCLPNN